MNNFWLFRAKGEDGEYEYKTLGGEKVPRLYHSAHAARCSMYHHFSFGNDYVKWSLCELNIEKGIVSEVTLFEAASKEKRSRALDAMDAATIVKLRLDKGQGALL